MPTTVAAGRIGGRGEDGRQLPACIARLASGEAGHVQNSSRHARIGLHRLRRWISGNYTGLGSDRARVARSVDTGSESDAAGSGRCEQLDIDKLVWLCSCEHGPHHCDWQGDVPQVSPTRSRPDLFSSTWVGTDGSNNSNLIQAGTKTGLDQWRTLLSGVVEDLARPGDANLINGRPSRRFDVCLHQQY